MVFYPTIYYMLSAFLMQQCQFGYRVFTLGGQNQLDILTKNKRTLFCEWKYGTYFVTKIALTYFEKKIVLEIEKHF